MRATLLMGAVCYDPKVVTIWTGFRQWFAYHGMPFDFVLYSHYERQVEDLVAGRLDAAWNSPLAWVRARRLAEAAGRTVRPLVMRDTDRDLTSVIVTRTDAGLEKLSDLAGRTVATGAVDSPQATLVPLAGLDALGIDVTVRRYNVGVGLHGDHVGGERDAARALVAGEVDAACLLDATHLMLLREGTLHPGATTVIGQVGPYDHCNMTVVDTARPELVERFAELLLGMDYGDARVRPLLDLEGLHSWEEGRSSGYDLIESATDRLAFYGSGGQVTATGYEP
jgi:ABC-type phosphate/phosphonate transport system substrate-binding protein